jgi:hypothetical protein
MPATCGICKHAERAAIEEAHVKGGSLRAIASQFAGTSPWSLARHFKHVPAIIAKVTEHQVAQNRATAKLPGRVEVLISELERMTANALRRNDYSSALRAIAGRLQCLRTIGELRGELRNGPRIGELVPGTAVQVNVNAPAVPAEGEAEKHARFMQTIANIYGVPWPREQPDYKKPN